MVKYCWKCKKDLTISSFNKNKAKKDGYCDQCKKCSSLLDKDYRKRNPTYSKYQKLNYNYGLSKDTIEVMFQTQESKCLICNCTTPKLRVDHDHSCCPGKRTCGKCIRGLLCDSCNKLIGFAKEDPTILENAIRYLKGAKGKITGKGK